MPGFWQDLIDKIKDAMSPDTKPEVPPTDQQHGAPLAPDPLDPHHDAPEARPDQGGPTGWRTPDVRPEYPDDEQTNSDGDAGGSNLQPGGVGREEVTGTGMTEAVKGPAEVLGAGVAAGAALGAAAGLLAAEEAAALAAEEAAALAAEEAAAEAGLAAMPSG